MRLLAEGRLLAVLSTIAIIGAVVGGLIVIGPPSQQRARRLDDQRGGHLKAISEALDSYWSEHATLPRSLSELAQASQLPLDLEDPEARIPYEYRVAGPTSYQLCARFARASDEREYVWAHGAGRQCFTLQPRPRERSKAP
jgi:hypothetical protein